MFQNKIHSKGRVLAQVNFSWEGTDHDDPGSSIPVKQALKLHGCFIPITVPVSLFTTSTKCAHFSGEKASYKPFINHLVCSFKEVPPK